MKYSNYKVLFAKPLTVNTVGNVDGRFLTRDFRDTNIKVKARNVNEAMNKAKRWFEDTGMKMGSITIEKIITTN